MKNPEIRDLTTAEVQERIKSEKSSYNMLRIQHKITAIEKSANITKSRKLIARLITELKNRELAAAKK